MAMEIFIRKQAANYPAATIRKNGSLCVNNKAIEQFHLEGKRFFTLHFDAKAGQMGIKPVDDDKDPSTFKVSKEKGKTFVIGCQAFLKAAKIPYWQGSKVLKADWDVQKRMIILKIS
jgi:hypothetical protein